MTRLKMQGKGDGRFQISMEKCFQRPRTSVCVGGWEGVPTSSLPRKAISTSFKIFSKAVEIFSATLLQKRLLRNLLIVITKGNRRD